jgi:hypothetical protein
VADPAITKQAAAQRQIDAAIRMLFLHEEDFCAIHTVAAAARNILKDLAAKRRVGHEHVTQECLQHVYKDLYGLDPANPSIAAEIKSKSYAIENDTRTWIYRNRTINFLKHGDKDAGAVLDLDELDPYWIIADALILWSNMNLPLTDEMLVFVMWLRGVTAAHPDDFLTTKSGPVHLFSFEQQIHFGRGLLQHMYKYPKRSATKFRDDTTHQFGPLRMYRPLE